MEELISVIIPVYNVEKYLRKCLDSVINQTYKNLEIILIDDGSTDNSGKICDDYAKTDKRIKVIHKENGGVSSARNKGIDLSTGIYINFIDADDYVELDMFEKLYKNIKEDDYDISICNHNYIEDSKVIPHVISEKNNVLNKNDFIRNLFGNNGYKGYLVNKLVKKACIKDIRLDEEIHIMEDIVFWLDVSANIQKGYLDKELFLYNYVQRDSSATHAFDDKKFFSIIKAYEKILPYLDVCDKDTRNSYFFYYLSYVMTEYYYCNEHEKEKFKKIKKEALRIRNKYFFRAINTNKYSLVKRIKLFILSFFPILYGKLKKLKDNIM